MRRSLTQGAAKLSKAALRPFKQEKYIQYIDEKFPEEVEEQGQIEEDRSAAPYEPEADEHGAVAVLKELKRQAPFTLSYLMTLIAGAIIMLWFILLCFQIKTNFE